MTTTNDDDDGGTVVTRAPRRSLPFDPGETARKTAQRPTITVDPGALDEVVTLAEQALIATGQPIYQQGGFLVRPKMMPVSASRGRETKAPGLKVLDPDSLTDHMARAANWQKPDGRRHKMVPCSPPRQVASILLTRAGEWQVPCIVGVVSAPAMRPDGTLITTPGYDQQTHLYYAADPGLRMPAIAERPDEADAEAALCLLEDLFSEFPFRGKLRAPLRDSLDFSVTLSALMSPFVRSACRIVPLHGFSSPEAGTGKSILVDVLATIITGRWCPAVAQSRSAEEMEKQLTGLLLAGTPIISIDNVMQTLSSPLLCQAVERPLLQVRPLGKSDIETIESYATFFATGNNLIIAGDLVRRSLRAVLDAGVERPETREFRFDPIARVMRDRGRYIAAVLTIIRAYRVVGGRAELAPFQGFNEWSRYVREPLVWLGLPDPVDSMTEVRDSDPRRRQLHGLVTAWEAAFGDERVTAADVVAAVKDSTTGGEPSSEAVELRDALLVVAGEKGGAVSQFRLGKYLAYHKGKIADGKRFLDDGLRRGVVRWYVGRVDGTYPSHARRVYTSQALRARNVTSFNEARRQRRGD
jgi:putative DNA primase/helicase